MDAMLLTSHWQDLWDLGSRVLLVAGTLYGIWFAGWRCKIYLDQNYVTAKEHEALLTAFERFRQRVNDDRTLRQKEDIRMERLLIALEKRADK